MCFFLLLASFWLNCARISKKNRGTETMWKRVIRGATPRQPWRITASKRWLSSSSSSSSSPTDISAAVDFILLRSLKEHYLEISKMNPPPKVNPPSAFSIIKGALDGNGPVLTRTYGNEEITISVMRMSYIIPGGGEDDCNEDDINQLFLHVNVSKPDQEKSLHFLCGLYPDALGIHAVSLRPKLGSPELLEDTSTYNGRQFGELDERMRDAFHGFIEERGLDENLFNFLQAWLYVKEHRSLMRWFKAVGTFINENKKSKNA